MTAKIISGREVAENILTSDLKNKVLELNKKNIEPKLDKNIIVSAHGNSIRSLCKYLFNLDNKKISSLEIPTGNPLLIETEKGNIKNVRYLDKDRAKDLLVF